MQNKKQYKNSTRWAF